jgi:4-oxalocrotonate tautomerase
MPLVRIDVDHACSPATRSTICDVVYEAMTSIAKVPANDRFMIVSAHPAGDLVYPQDGYLGITYTTSLVYIQITWNAGRTTEVKQAFYRQVADGIHTGTGIRKQDVLINLVEVAAENWSFGNGEMQYAKT